MNGSQIGPPAGCRYSKGGPLPPTFTFALKLQCRMGIVRVAGVAMCRS